MIGVEGISSMTTQDLKLTIDGMHCGACVRRVTAALQKVEGVEVEKVDVGSAQVKFDADKASKEEVVDAVNGIGFTAREA